MKKTLISCATAASLALGALAVPTSAEARGGGALAAGIIGGLAVGAIIGSAAANPYGNPYYAPAPAPVYYGPACYWTDQRVWDGYGWRIARVRVCN
jgi:fucose permease